MSVHPSYTFALGSFAPIIKMYFNEHNAYFTWALLALEFYRGRGSGGWTDTNLIRIGLFRKFCNSQFVPSLAIIPTDWQHIKKSPNINCLGYFYGTSSAMYFVSATLYHALLTLTLIARNITAMTYS